MLEFKDRPASSPHKQSPKTSVAGFPLVLCLQLQDRPASRSHKQSPKISVAGFSLVLGLQLRGDPPCSPEPPALCPPLLLWESGGSKKQLRKTDEDKRLHDARGLCVVCGGFCGGGGGWDEPPALCPLLLRVQGSLDIKVTHRPRVLR